MKQKISKQNKEKQKNRNQGFTLIELLVVVVIIGILAAIVLPQYKLAVAKSKLTHILPLFASIRQAQENYYMLYNEYTGNVKDLDIDLSHCKKASDSSVALICDKYFIITLLDGGEWGYLRAAYCPGEIKGNRSWNKCAYQVGDYVYHLNYFYAKHNKRPFCYYVHSDLGRKVCQSFDLPIESP